MIKVHVELTNNSVTIGFTPNIKHWVFSGMYSRERFISEIDEAKVNFIGALYPERVLPLIKQMVQNIINFNKKNIWVNWPACGNCQAPYNEHADGVKCLFQPTEYLDP